MTGINTDSGELEHQFSISLSETFQKVEIKNKGKVKIKNLWSEKQY